MTKNIYSHHVLEATLDPLFALSIDGHITDANAAAALLTGLAEKKLIGTYLSDYVTEPVKMTQMIALAEQTGVVSDCLFRFKNHNYEGKNWSLNASVAKNNDGIFESAYAAFRPYVKPNQIETGIPYKRVHKLIVAPLPTQTNQESSTDSSDQLPLPAELELAYQQLQLRLKVVENRSHRLNTQNKELSRQKKENEQSYLIREAFHTSKSNKDISSKYSLSLIEASRDPLVTISADGKITDVNEAMVKVTGVNRKDLKNSDFKIYFTDPEKAAQVYHEVFTKGFVADYPLTIKDHKLTEVLFNGSVYKDELGKVLGAVIVARDITEQKRVEKELTESIVVAELATGLAEQAQAKAENATQIAVDAVKSKQQFLSNMSHEIRTPMNAIIGFTKVLLKTNLSNKQKEYLSAIKMSGDALIVLINDILDLAKVEAGKMQFEKTPFRLALSITSMLHLFEAKIQEKNLALIKTYDQRIPQVLLGDPARLHQIILNLISNAVKFTSTGSISMGINLIKEDEHSVTIEFKVDDTGIGISETKLLTIFENFQQATSSTSRLFGGTGLGLAIAKQLVESQGGSIRVESEILKGSRFSFVLTFQKTDLPAESEMGFAVLNPEVDNVKVLVVEDIPLNQLLMKTLLDDFGFERDIAPNGRIAIEKLAQKEYDLILMDLQMPEMNGFDATEYIRHVMHLDTPIIALTADVTTADLEKCTAVGMNDYIAKPVDEKVLYTKIINLIHKPAFKTKSASEKDTSILTKNQNPQVRYIDLTYLNHRTKSDPILMKEMIDLYLEQTPALVLVMKQSWLDRDWNALQAAVHKMIPSFTIMGMNKDFETMAKRVQEYAVSLDLSEEIENMVAKIEEACLQACVELKEEIKKLTSQP